MNGGENGKPLHLTEYKTIKFDQKPIMFVENDPVSTEDEIEKTEILKKQLRKWSANYNFAEIWYINLTTWLILKVFFLHSFFSLIFDHQNNIRMPSNILNAQAELYMPGSLWDSSFL